MHGEVQFNITHFVGLKFDYDFSHTVPKFLRFLSTGEELI